MSSNIRCALVVVRPARLLAHPISRPCLQCRVQDDRFRNTAGQSKLASTMVELFEQVRSRFTVDDYRHYLFTPRELTAWVHGLLRYGLGSR